MSVHALTLYAHATIAAPLMVALFLGARRSLRVPLEIHQPTEHSSLSLSFVGNSELSQPLSLKQTHDLLEIASFFFQFELS
jgi:hypothetical protein